MRAERLNEVLDYIADRGRVDVHGLANRLGVSGATIRRDLRVLHEQGLLVRTHGGALANVTSLELPIRYKTARRQPEKQRIGACAARLVEDGAVVGSPAARPRPRSPGPWPTGRGSPSSRTRSTSPPS